MTETQGKVITQEFVLYVLLTVVFAMCISLFFITATLRDDIATNQSWLVALNAQVKTLVAMDQMTEELKELNTSIDAISAALAIKPAEEK